MPLGRVVLRQVAVICTWLVFFLVIRAAVDDSFFSLGVGLVLQMGISLLVAVVMNLGLAWRLRVEVGRLKGGNAGCYSQRNAFGVRNSYLWSMPLWERGRSDSRLRALRWECAVCAFLLPLWVLEFFLVVLLY